MLIFCVIKKTLVKLILLVAAHVIIVIAHQYLINKTRISQLILTFVTVGDYDVTQLTEAQVAWFNMWSYQMSEEQLNNLSCNSIGDAANQNGMQLSGTSQLTYETFYCKGER